MSIEQKIADLEMSRSFGAKWRDVVFALELLEGKADAVGSNISFRYFTDVVKGKRLMKIDIYRGRHMTKIHSTGYVPQLRAIKAAIHFLHVYAERELRTEAWEHFYSNKGTFADRMRRKFL